MDFTEFVEKRKKLALEIFDAMAKGDKDRYLELVARDAELVSSYCKRKITPDDLATLARIQNFIVSAAFEALQARLAHDLVNYPGCREIALKAVEEYKGKAEDAAGILVFMRPRRLGVLHLSLLLLGVVVGFYAASLVIP